MLCLSVGAIAEVLQHPRCGTRVILLMKKEAQSSSEETTGLETDLNS